MRAIAWLLQRQQRLDIVAGLVDDILTALTLAAGRLLGAGAGIDIGLSLRVAAATGVSSLFVFFIAHYAELRTQLIHAERELNLVSNGHLATTSLGQAVLREVIAGALLASACSLLGAVLPLVLSAVLPGPAWLGAALTIAMLGGLGALLARTVHGNAMLWASGLVCGGIIITVVGIKLDIVG